MDLVTMMMTVAPSWWAAHHERMRPVAAAIERATQDARTRALLAAIDYHETQWHTARGRFAPFGVMLALRRAMTEDEVLSLALRYLDTGRQRCGSALGMLGFYHFGRCRVTAFERLELRTWRRFTTMLGAPAPGARTGPVWQRSEGRSTSDASSTHDERV
jgi:hypothetical protein